MKNKGFTLIEMIIYIALFTGIIISIVGFTLSIINMQNKQTSSRNINIHLNTSLNQIAVLIRHASQISFSDSHFDTHPAKLVLIMPESEISPTVIEIDNVTQQLSIKQGLEEAVFLTPPYWPIKKFTINNLSSDTVQAVRINLEMTSYDQADVYTKYRQDASLTVKLRP